MNESVESVRAADAIAIERTLAGERDAFRVLVERHSGTIFRLAYRLTGNHHDAEEIVQEAFLRAYRAGDSSPVKLTLPLGCIGLRGITIHRSPETPDENGRKRGG